MVTSGIKTSLQNYAIVWISGPGMNFIPLFLENLPLKYTLFIGVWFPEEGPTEFIDIPEANKFLEAECPLI